MGENRQKHIKRYELDNANAAKEKDREHRENVADRVAIESIKANEASISAAVSTEKIQKSREKLAEWEANMAAKKNQERRYYSKANKEAAVEKAGHNRAQEAEKEDNRERESAVEKAKAIEKAAEDKNRAATTIKHTEVANKDRGNVRFVVHSDMFEWQRYLHGLRKAWRKKLRHRVNEMARRAKRNRENDNKEKNIPKEAGNEKGADKPTGALKTDKRTKTESGGEGKTE